MGRYRWIAFLLVTCSISFLFTNAVSFAPEDLLTRYATQWGAENYDLYWGRVVRGPYEFHAAFEPPADATSFPSTMYHAVGGPIIGLIDSVPSGSKIRFGIHLLSHEDFADAMIRAINRNVDVQILLSNIQSIRDPSGSTPYKLFAEVSSAIAAKGNPNSFILICPNGSEGGCIGNGKNHNKFLTLSRVCKFGLSNSKCINPGSGEIEFYERVVVQTSLNFSKSNLKQYNTMSVFEDRDLYKIFIDYFDDMVESATLRVVNLDYRFSKGVSFQNGSEMIINATPWKNLSGVTDDVVLAPLSRLACRSVGNEKTKVLFSNAHWTNVQAANVAALLQQLQQKGCQVRVLGSSMLGDQKGLTGFSEAELEEARLIAEDIVMRGLDLRGVQNHSKYVAVKEPDSLGDNAQNLLMFGSVSITSPSQTKNDEVWIVWSKPSLEALKLYEETFEARWAIASSQHYSQPFGCSVDSNNSGCSGTRVSCSGGKAPLGIRANCNLETVGSVQQSLQVAPWNTVSVSRASDIVSNGFCRLNQTTIQEGLVGILPANVEYFGCKEHDNNGGDCRIEGELLCIK